MPPIVVTEALFSRALFKNILEVLYTGRFAVVYIFKFFSAPPDGVTIEYENRGFS